MSDRNLETVQVIFQHATASAICVRETEYGPDVWLPRSQVEISECDPDRGDIVTIQAPEWLLVDRGLL